MVQIGGHHYKEMWPKPMKNGHNYFLQTGLVHQTPVFLIINVLLSVLYAKSEIPLAMFLSMCASTRATG